MNANRRVQTLLCLVVGLSHLGFSPAGLSSQDSPPRDELLAGARQIIETAGYCGLVTFDELGNTRVRLMDPFLPDEDWSIWMGTDRGTRKVQDIQRDSRVTLYYYSSDLVGYVSVHGTAYLVDDAGEKSSRWKDEWEALYPNRDEQYLLIKVIPDRLEVINYSSGIQGDPTTWAPPFVEFRGGRLEPHL